MSNLHKLKDASPQVRKNVVRRVAQMLGFNLLIIMILFLSAGTVTWLFGWVYIVCMLLIQLTGAIFLPLEVLAERGSKKENAEKWDRVITGFILLSFIGIYLVAGLDRRLTGVSHFPVSWQLVGGLLFLLGCALEIWAMASNRFFSTAVRLQFERGHQVCDQGPYRVVRHPGYAGMIVYYLASPVFLGSLWALIPAGMIVVLFVIRTGLEDKTLQEKLPGYREYASRVRHRLLPGI